MAQAKGGLLVSSDINWGQALATGLADAVIWVWFLATAYTSRFTGIVSDVSCFQLENFSYHTAVCIVVSVLLISSRWNVVPRRCRVICSLGCVLTVALLVAINGSGLVGSHLDVAVSLLFTAFYYSSQVLRVETLSRCDSVRTLLMAAMVSFVAYYLISAALLIVPSWLYLTCVVLAPLAFLCGVRPKQGMTAGVGTAAGAAHESSAQVYSGPSDMSPATSWRAWLTPAALLMLLFGITGGLITASGDAVPASTLDELLSMPSPVYLAMVLVYLVLGILVVRGRRLHAVAFYVMMSVAWMLGTFTGGAILAMLPGLPPMAFVIFASTIALLIAASFVAFRNLWISVPDSLGSDRVSRIEELSNQAGLTKRESEVFRLLAEGRSLPYVQEKLFISEGTARTHIKHIYTKLDVHSKQEMLDKIEF